MKMKKISIFITLFSLLFFNYLTETFAQSQFMEKGKSGFDFGGGYSFNSDFSGLSAIVGYSGGGIIDIGLAIGRSTQTVESLNSDIKATSINPYLNFYLLKESNNIPLSLNVGASYFNTSFSGGYLSDYGIDMSATGYSIDSGIHKMISISSSLILLPRIGVSYSSATAEITNGSTATQDQNSTSFDFALGFGFKVSSEDIFYIWPGVDIDENDTTIKLLVGFTIPTTRPTATK